MDKLIISKLLTLHSLLYHLFKESVRTGRIDSDVQIACTKVTYWINDMESEQTRHRINGMTLVRANVYYKRYKNGLINKT